jgi:hypothetical protein
MSMDKNQLTALAADPHFSSLSSSQQSRIKSALTNTSSSTSSTSLASSDSFKLPTGEYISKTVYDSLSAEDKSVLSKLGVKGYEAWNDKTRNLALLDGNKIALVVYNMLSEADKTLLKEKGLVDFTKTVEGRSVKLSTGEYIAKADYDSMPADEQKVLVDKGFAGFSDWYNNTKAVKLDTGEYVVKAYYDSLVTDKIPTNILPTSSVGPTGLGGSDLNYINPSSFTSSEAIRIATAIRAKQYDYANLLWGRYTSDVNTPEKRVKAYNDFVASTTPLIEELSREIRSDQTKLRSQGLSKYVLEKNTAGYNKYASDMVNYINSQPSELAAMTNSSMFQYDWNYKAPYDTMNFGTRLASRYRITKDQWESSKAKYLAKIAPYKDTNYGYNKAKAELDASDLKAKADAEAARARQDQLNSSLYAIGKSQQPSTPTVSTPIATNAVQTSLESSIDPRTVRNMGRRNQSVRGTSLSARLTAAGLR